MSTKSPVRRVRAAGIHQAAGSALAAIATTGVRKGIYRFKSHAEMNRHTEEAQARAVALNAAHREILERALADLKRSG
jgi:hypothetical protein